MRYRAGKSSCAARIAWTCLACLLFSGVAPAEAPEDTGKLLDYAYDIKTSRHAEFLEVLRRLEDRSGQMKAGELVYLRYLKAYESSYSGDYEHAIPPLTDVIAQAEDVALRFRATITLTNILALSAHYDDAYKRLNELLELQAQIPDKRSRLLGFGIAAILYNQAGQYDLALTYSDHWIAEDTDGTGACKGMYSKIEALYRSGKLQRDDVQVQQGIDACKKIGDPIYANLIRTFAANLSIDQERPADAIALLTANYAEVELTRYTRLTSEVDSILANAYLKSGDLAQARKYAQSAIDKSVRNEITKPLVDAYEVLYEVAKARGSPDVALEYHEKYAVADKGYLTDTTARTLAYQMVNQQVLDKKRQIDALTENNQVLQLQQEVAEKSEETERLYVLLLVSVLGFLVLWAYRTKRSQLRFQKLARRDGLTGILNRQHFMDEAKAVLEHCNRSGREACMILVDFDNFKTVNDTHGHVAGDVVLQSAVAVLQVHMRANDIFGRLGGEEFGILLPDCGLDTALQRAELLRVAIAGLTRSETGIDFDVSASFGVTTTIETGYDLRQMLIHGDSALYRAKREGRNRVATFLATLVADSPEADSVAPMEH